MNSDEAIDKALEGVLSNDEWQVLMSDHTTLKELEQHLGMDALLRVALEKNDTSAALSDAIEASVKTSSVDDLMRGIEAATIGRRRQRRWLTSLPHWTTAAAAILIGLLGGTLAWPDIFLRLDLGPTVAQRTGKHVILHGHIIAKPPAPPLVVTPEPVLLPPTPAALAVPAAPNPPAPQVMVVEKKVEPAPTPQPPPPRSVRCTRRCGTTVGSWP